MCLFSLLHLCSPLGVLHQEREADGSTGDGGPPGGSVPHRGDAEQRWESQGGPASSQRMNRAVVGQSTHHPAAHTHVFLCTASDFIYKTSHRSKNRPQALAATVTSMQSALLPSSFCMHFVSTKHWAGKCPHLVPLFSICHDPEQSGERPTSVCFREQDSLPLGDQGPHMLLSQSQTWSSSVSSESSLNQCCETNQAFGTSAEKRRVGYFFPRAQFVAKIQIKTGQQTFYTCHLWKTNI